MIANLVEKPIQNKRRLLQQDCSSIFPSWANLQAKQTEITPNVNILSNPFADVYFLLHEAIKVTVIHVPEDVVLSHDYNINLKIRFVFDGSGSHAIFKQKSNVMTNNIILTMFCPLEIESGNCWLCNVKIEQKHSMEDLRRRIHVHYNEDVLRLNRLRLSGQLYQQEGTSWAKKIMSFGVDGPTSRSRSTLRWKDVVNTDLY